MEVSEELVNRLERLADVADTNQLLIAILNGLEELKKDMEMLKKAANITEEDKEEKEEQVKKKGRPPKDG